MKNVFLSTVLFVILSLFYSSCHKINQKVVKNMIEAIWQCHVLDKKTGEINRHNDGKRGCDFSMSAGAYIEAFG
jgi:hypothetical protein